MVLHKYHCAGNFSDKCIVEINKKSPGLLYAQATTSSSKYTKITFLPSLRYPISNYSTVLECIPWIRGPRDKKVVRRTSERRNRTSGRMKSKPRSDELSLSHQSGTCSWSAQSQVTDGNHFFL